MHRTRTGCGSGSGGAEARHDSYRDGGHHDLAGDDGLAISFGARRRRNWSTRVVQMSASGAMIDLIGADGESTS